MKWNEVKKTFSRVKGGAIGNQREGKGLRRRIFAGAVSITLIASSLSTDMLVARATEEQTSEEITLSALEDVEETIETSEEESESVEERQEETTEEQSHKTITKEAITVSEIEETTTLEEDSAALAILNDEKIVTEDNLKDGKEEGLFVYYDFDLQNSFSTVISDASNHRNAGELKSNNGGSVEGNYSIDEVNIYGKKVKALKLPGGSDGVYLQLPENILDGYRAVTISMWVNLSQDQNYQRLFDFGTGTDKYWYALSDGGNDGFKGYATGVTTGGWSNEKGVEKGSNFEKNRWVLITAVYEDSKITLFENGEKIGSKNTNVSLKELWKTSNNYIGKSQFGSDSLTTGQFAEIKIFGKALSEEEIADMYQVNEDLFADADASELKIEDPDCITEDFDLITKGNNGSDISWESKNSAITISEDGTKAIVTRPAKGEDDVKGQLIAKVKYGNMEVEKEFDVTVLAEYTDLQIVTHDAEYLEKELGDLTAITKNIDLILKGEWGSDISYESQHDAIIIEEKTGKITRPAIGEEAVTGKLLVTISCGEETITKEFEVTVLPFSETILIKLVDPIEVVTAINHKPALPNFVKVTYTDDTINKVKMMWPEIAKADYSVIGEFEVEGTIVGETTKAIARVKVISESDVEKEVVSDNFDLSDITLDVIGEGSILTQNRDRDVAYLKLLDKDRMLYNFYKTYGLTDKINDVEPLGGWDEPTGLLRGHSTGHYMSALALAYASTGDEELSENLEYVVHQLRKMQLMAKGEAKDFTSDSTDQSQWSDDVTTWGEGFLSAYSPDQFALLERYTPYAQIWAPYYTLHKLMAGLIDAYQYTGNEEALETACALGDWVYNRLSACDEEQLTKMWDMYIAGEFGGFDESLAQLYIYTGEEKYLKGAKLFDNTTFFDNLADNEDDIAGRHANQHIPQIIGALKIYEATVQQGNPEIKYYNIAKNFWERTVSAYCFSTGGVGKGEKFTKPYTQANSIAGTTNAETCAAYNMLKLTKMLANYEPDNAEFMDYYERTLYNQILASQTPNVTVSMHNGTTYMLPLGPGSTRSYGGDYDSFSCCHGTGMENHVKYQEAAYVKAGNDLYVNLYLPTKLNWEEKGLTIKQVTEFPSEETSIKVEGKEGKKVNLRLRVPYWATEGFYVSINGEEQNIDAEICSYIELKDISAGDTIDIRMPYTLHLDKTPDKLGTSEVASIMYGPFVMAGHSDNTDWKTLILSQKLGESIKISKDEKTNLPMLTTNGYKFYPMFAPIFATEAYDAYYKVITANDDGRNWYEAKITNNSPKYGDFSLDQDFVKEGSTIKITATPKEGYMVKKLLINGQEVEVNVDNTYYVENISGNLVIEGSFRRINASINDKDHLEYSATVSSDYTASWENIEGIMTDWEPSVSKNGIGRGWGNWPQTEGSEHYVQYEWDDEVTINKLEVFWYDDEGDTSVPGSIKIMYQNDQGEWEEAFINEKFDDVILKDTFNTITFSDITTSSLRLVMTVASGKAANGIYRLKVSGTEKKQNDDNQPEKPNPDKTGEVEKPKPEDKGASPVVDSEQSVATIKQNPSDSKKKSKKNSGTTGARNANTTKVIQDDATALSAAVVKPINESDKAIVIQYLAKFNINIQNPKYIYTRLDDGAIIFIDGSAFTADGVYIIVPSTVVLKDGQVVIGDGHSIATVGDNTKILTMDMKMHEFKLEQPVPLASSVTQNPKIEESSTISNTQDNIVNVTSDMIDIVTTQTGSYQPIINNSGDGIAKEVTIVTKADNATSTQHKIPYYFTMIFVTILSGVLFVTKKRRDI